jgi:uncharacterized protein YijF (DUF1287 family)
VNNLTKKIHFLHIYKVIQIVFATILLFILSTTTALPEGKNLALIAAARSQIGVTTSYNSSYMTLKYPGGDVPIQTGCCTDVLIRAFRKLNIDLQKLVHEDMKSNFSHYPRKWGMKAPDTNIDHRRVPNLMKYFERNGEAVKISKNPKDYYPGNLVAWNLGKGILHIGIVSDRKTSDGIPLVIHNIGQGAKEENILFQFELIGHYRYDFRK